jgi:mannose-1-phosphate guanylyltransferase
MKMEAALKMEAVMDRAEARDNLWAIVLAGGEGWRLRPLVNRLYGEDRPKQYAKLTGSRSMLQHTLDRVALEIAPEQTLVVTMASHAKYLAEQFTDRYAQRLLIQPENRGTAAAVLYPAHWIEVRSPDATVAIFPSDHFVLEEREFMGRVREAANAIQRHPEWMVLLGVKATEPETEYGWVEPGETVCSANFIRRVRRFIEKPSYAAACESYARGHLWNTFVFVAKLGTLIRCGNEFAPLLGRQLDRVSRYKPGPDQQWALQQAYESMPHLNFSRLVLEHCRSLAVSEMPGITWSDWGTPRRVVRSLERAGMSPEWMADDACRFWRGNIGPYWRSAVQAEAVGGTDSLRN